ncbi:CHAT domain-containing protein [Frankia sp. AiPa1]|uniref:CHAT domain-containing tetratricopeptide repeat protein n=1 Tax=Frankia sp. AiPa1 TaxID=573492 RepID=UPI00202B99AC|nr:CHAT domain-containing protein [Frankia sp. AiPa1]MCL9759118.1 CHAT domain-containing protein [Frankia sp. AiPa1]
MTTAVDAIDFAVIWRLVEGFAETGDPTELLATAADRRMAQLLAAQPHLGVLLDFQPLSRPRTDRTSIGTPPIPHSPSDADTEDAEDKTLAPDRDALVTLVQQVRTAGWFYWARSHALGPGRGRVDLSAAMALLRPLHTIDPSLVPSDIAEAINGAQPADEDGPWPLHDSALTLWPVAARTGVSELFDVVIAMVTQAVLGLPADDPDRGIMLTNLAGIFHGRYPLRAERSDLDDAVTSAQAAVAVTPEGATGLAARLTNFSLALRARHEHLGDDDDLAAAADVGRQAVQAAPAGHPDRVRVLGNVAATLLARHGQTQSDADLTDAVALARESVTTDDPGQPGAAIRRSNAALVLRALFRRTGDPALLAEAVSLARQAHAIDEDDPFVLTNLSVLLVARYRLAGDVEDLATALELGRVALAGCAPGDPARPRRLIHLSVMLTELARLPPGALPPGGPIRQDNDQSDNDQSDGQRGDGTQTDDDSRGPDGAPVGSDNGSGGEAPGNGMTVDQAGQHPLDEAVTMAAAAVEQTPAEHPDLPAHLTSLAAAAQARYDRRNDPADLDLALAAGTRALDLFGPQHAERPTCLTNLGIALRTRCALSGDDADLDQAIDLAREAVAATPPDHVDLAARRANLAVALVERFEHTGASAAATEAIEVLRLAAGTLAADDPATVLVRLNLAAALQSLIGRSSWVYRDDPMALADEAVEHARSVVDLARPGHSDRAAALTTLGGALLSRYELMTSLPPAVAELVGSDSDPVSPCADLDKAIEIARSGLAATSPRERLRPAVLVNICAMLVERHTRRLHVTSPGQHGPDQHTIEADLDEAIRMADDALALLQPEQPEQARALLHLGRALQTRHTVAGGRASLERADLERAGVVLNRAAAMTIAPTVTRVRAAASRGEVAMTLADLEPDDERRSPHLHAAADSYTLAIDLLALLAPRDLDRHDQEVRLAEISGLARDAAAALIRAGRPQEALLRLDQGRGVLLGQAYDVRTDLTDLARVEPELASRFEAVRLLLGAAANNPLEQACGETAAVQPQILHRRELAAELADLTERIRARPGCADFLRPPSVEQMCMAAAGGPVVVVNVSRYRCDALIVTADGVDHLALRAVTEDDVRTQVIDLLRAVDVGTDPTAPAEGLADADANSRRLLAWLWHAIAEPILNRLRSLGTLPSPGDSDSPPPRLWWCPTGLLSYLPLHAAGLHDPAAPPGQAVIDHVVSSYTPTVRSLLWSRTRPVRAARPASGDVENMAGPGTPRVLAVAMPATPGQRSLPGADREVAMLHETYPGQVSVLRDADATRAAVLTAVDGSTWTHFACHATSDPVRPSDSLLLVHDHETAPLTVSDLDALRLEAACLGFLSACTTARPAPALVDEAIHLLSGLQLAGYRHVVGSLWPVSDRITLTVATRFYQELARASDAEADSSAIALHAAIQQLREVWADVPTVWASFVHTGR